MDIINSIILGLIQGITEFLPISSSGHLILAREVLGEQVEYGLAFDAILQLATTLAVFVYFRKDILGYIKNFFLWIFQKEISSRDKNLLKALVWGTIPAIILGVLLESSMETIFRNPLLISLTLIIGAVIMFFADREIKAETENINTKKGFYVGLFQALALIPGMSRSGMTISGGLFNGLSREEATRFSFLLAFPILVGSGLKKFFDLYQENLLGSLGSDLLIGSIIAFVVGILAIHFLIKYLKNHSMRVFVIYRVLMAIFILFWFV